MQRHFTMNGTCILYYYIYYYYLPEAETVDNHFLLLYHEMVPEKGKQEKRHFLPSHLVKLVSIFNKLSSELIWQALCKVIANHRIGV